MALGSAWLNQKLLVPARPPSVLADTKHRRRARLKDGPWDALALQTLEADLTTATLALLECGGWARQQTAGKQQAISGKMQRIQA